MTYTELIEKAEQEFEVNTGEIRSKYYITRPLTEKEIEQNKGFFEINTIENFYDTPTDRFELFKSCFASYMFEYEKLMFVKANTHGSMKYIVDELQIITDWINNAKEIKYNEVFHSDKDREDFINAKHEYIRLETGYYNTHLMKNNLQLSETSVSAKVYGRYFLFKTYLESIISGETIAEKHLYFFKAAMEDFDYNVMIEQVNHYFENLLPPKKVIAVNNVKLTKNVIVYTFREMYKNKTGRASIKENYFPFLSRLFTQLYDERAHHDLRKSTLYKNYHEKPKNYDYLKSTLLKKL